MNRQMRSAVQGFFVAGVLAAVGVAGAQEPGADDGAFAMGNQGRMVRGTVTATSADRLTLKTEAGDVYQVVVTTNTRMMKDRQPVKLGDVHAGDGAGAMGVVETSTTGAPTKTVHAVMLMVVDAAQIKKMKEDMGKTYISGKVTAIDDVQITVHRSDGVDQKITVDEGTSFKKGGRGAGMAMRGEGFGGAMGTGVGAGPGASSAGASGAGASGPGASGAGGRANGGESITLADIKVGDMVGGPGALKAGVFVPTQLMVVDAATMARRRRPEGGDAAPGAEALPVPAGANPH